MFHPSLHELRRLCTALIIAIAAVQLNAQIIGYDRLGNGYTAEDLAVPAGGGAQMMGGAGFCNPCSAGIFQLTFWPGSGMEMNTPLGIARQQVAIQVFEDLSVLISPADNPYTLTPNTAPFVQVQFRNTASVTGVDWTQTLGFGSTIRNYVNTEAVSWCTTFTGSGQREGILDGEVWRTINGGIDSWYAIWPALINSPLPGYAHGFIALNFSGTPTNMYTGQTLPPMPNTDADLYTVIAHEAMHMLGVETLIQTNGLGLNNTRYYSRYDHLVYANGVPWITDPLVCANWAANVGNVADLLTGACGDIELDGPTINPSVPLFPGNLPHFDGVCESLAYLMHPDNTNPLGQSRIPLQEEVNVLCDMDYHTTTEHGFSGTSWDGTYQMRTACGLRLAGVDDYFVDYTTLEHYSLQQPGSILINNFLDNDEDQFLGGEPVEFTCLEVLVGGGTATVVGQTSVTYTPGPSFVGTAILRYKPLNVATNRTGNFSFIFIEVWPHAACDNCNILNGGDFEELAIGNRVASPHANFVLDGSTANTPDHLSWLPGLSEWRNGQDCGNASQKCGPATAPIQDSWNGQASGNEHYVAMGDFQAGLGEGVLFQLCSPMVAGKTYDIEFQGTTGSTCLGALQFYAFTDRPCSPEAGGIDFTAATPCTNGMVPYQILPGPVTFGGPAWSLQSNTIAYTGPTANWVIAVMDDPAPPGSFVFVDDFVIRPHISVQGTVVDACAGQDNGSISLSIDYPEIFTVTWSNGANTPFIDNLTPGSYTATVSVLGCVILQNFTVGMQPCAPLTLTKTVSTTNTYSGAPVLYTITICNNTAVPATMPVTDSGLSNFAATSITPAWPNFPAEQGFLVPAGECLTIEIAGHFTAINDIDDPNVNCVTISPADSPPLTACADPVNVRQNCPLAVSGTGDCTNGPVNMCMSVHSLITNIGVIEFDWVYPAFLTPPTQAALLGALTPPSGAVFSNATITGPTTPPAPYDLYNGVAYNMVHLRLPFDQPFSTFGHSRMFCVPFDLDAANVPEGMNTFITLVLGSNGVHRTDLYEPNNGTGNGAEIHPGAGFMTQAANVILTGCPGIQQLDASFTVDVPACGGAVSVHGNLTDPAAIHFWTWGDDRTTPINGAQDYTYDYFAAITMNTEWPVVPPIPPAAPGTYTITHTVIVDGVASNSTQAVTIHACCPAALSIPHGTLSSTLPSTISGTVDIQGQFIIDQNLSFNGVQVTMEPGAEIIVQPGRNFNVFGSTIESCQGVMWRGITGNDGSIVQVDDSRISDAEAGWTGLNSSILLVSGSELKNNRTGISVPAIPGVDFNSVSIYVTNSNFHAEGPLAQPFPGQTTTLGQTGYAALDVNNMSLDFTGNGNEIHHLSNGIVAHRSNVGVANCTMHDIQPDAAYTYVGNGAAIYARGTDGFFSLKQSGYGTNWINAASFTNCRWGMYTEYMNVRSANNRMVDMGTAYRVDRSGYMKVDILDNNLDTRYNGIDLRFNDGAAHLLVAGNDITFGNLFHYPPTKGYAAVNVQEGNTQNLSSVIQGNVIHFRPGSSSAANGIALLSASDYNVLGNSLWMADNTVNRMGIITAGCKRHLVSCNDVHGSGSHYGVYEGQSAIRNNMGDHATLYCNTVDGTTNGIYFSGPCYGTDLSGNNIKRHQWGLHLDNYAVIEAQDQNGNLWYGDPVNGGLGAWYENAFNAQYYPFLYAPATIIGGNTEPSSWSPSYWFNSQPGTNYQCGDEQSGYCGHVVREVCESCTTGLDQKIAADSLENDPYTEETKWVMKGDLYAKLDNDSLLLATDQELADFYADMQGTTAAQFKLINDDYLALFHLDSTVLNYLTQNKAQLDTLMDQLKLAMTGLGDTSLTSTERLALYTTIGGLQQNISSLTALNSQALALADTSRVLTAESVKTTNASIGTSELIEANTKQVNNIYLSTVGKGIDGFTSEQATTLFSIANQCPLTGGNAVYRARAMYALIDDEQAYDDPALCLQHGLIYKSTKQVTGRSVSVIPNPASEEVTLRYGLAENEKGTFTLYDAMGHPVLRRNLPTDSHEIRIPTSQLSPAAYHYVVYSTLSGVLGEGKLVIIH